jgi:hypothetical protein
MFTNEDGEVDYESAFNFTHFGDEDGFRCACPGGGPPPPPPPPPPGGGGAGGGGGGGGGGGAPQQRADRIATHTATRLDPRRCVRMRPHTQ